MEEIDLKELIQIFLEKRTQIILITLICMAIGLIYSIGFVTPKYETSTSLLLATNSSSTDQNQMGTESITTTDVTINSKLVGTYSELVKSKKIIRNVISNLALDIEYGTLRKNVSVTAVSNTEIIKISVKNEDAVISAKVANEIAKVFIENVKEFYGIENVHVVDQAETPTGPSNINHTKTVIIFGFIGIVASVMYILILNMMDTTVKNQEDLEKMLGLPVLATLPLCEKYEEVSKNQRKGGKR